MFFQDKRVTISTTVSSKLYNDAKKKGYRHSDLWLLGYQIKEKNPVLDRVREVEQISEERKKDYYMMKKELMRLREELAKLKGE